MTTALPVGPLTPYITPELLTQFPTGVSWASLVPGRMVPGQATNAAMANVCAAATSLVDEYCRQPLRATIDTLPLTGPGAFRVMVPRDRSRTQPATLTMTRWPVLSVVSIRVSPNTFPRSWTTIPAGNYEPKRPVVGLYGSVAPPAAGEGGQGITVAPGWFDWRYGAEGFVIETEYINGWPHCSLTSDAAQGASQLQVDDCTGWAVTAAAGGNIGATGTVYDAGSQEVIHVQSASAAQGAGTLALSAPLANAHAAGTMISTLPESVIQGAVWFCCSIALTRGATATSNREIPAAGASTAGPMSPQALVKAAQGVLDPFRRII